MYRHSTTCKTNVAVTRKRCTHSPKSFIFMSILKWVHRICTYCYIVRIVWARAAPTPPGALAPKIKQYAQITLNAYEINTHSVNWQIVFAHLISSKPHLGHIFWKSLNCKVPIPHRGCGKGPVWAKSQQSGLVSPAPSKHCFRNGAIGWVSLAMVWICSEIAKLVQRVLNNYVSLVCSFVFFLKEKFMITNTRVIPLISGPVNSDVQLFQLHIVFNRLNIANNCLAQVEQVLNNRKHLLWAITNKQSNATSVQTIVKRHREAADFQNRLILDL